MIQTARRKLFIAFISATLLTMAFVWVVVALNTRDESAIETEPASFIATLSAASAEQQIARGAYLARVGNCASCHTQPGGAAYAGGVAIDTPFGAIYAGNLTPDIKTGLGTWNTSHFWRAMHNGRSKDGHLLYPAFPYQQMTIVTRADSDAIFLYLRSLPAVEQPNKAHALRWPYNTQAALALWRAMFFKPARHQTQPDKSALWNRGSYLIEGLAHCAACHAPRNVLGAITADSPLSGGSLLVDKWFAPSLLHIDEASVANWSDAEVVKLLQTGVAKHGSVNGAMAKVVFGSTQYLTAEDLQAMANYLKTLPVLNKQSVQFEPAEKDVMLRGSRIYEQHCANCHGDKGEGVVGVYPSLNANRAVNMQNTNNLIRTIVEGGFAPVTEKNPRPYGMPPLGHVLSDRDIADVLTFVRQSFQNHAAILSELEVMQARD